MRADTPDDEIETAVEVAPVVLVPEREGFDRYLEDTIVVDWQTPTVLEKARGLVEGLDAEQDRVNTLFTFVRDEISHSLDANSDAVTCNASHVLREGTGLCYAKSHLLVALLRSCGIPAGFGYQRLRQDTPASRFALHGFAAVWLEGRDTWVALDPRGDTDEIHTELDIERPSLAFTPDTEAGELTYPTVWSRPAKRVIDLLDHAESLARIRDHLPSTLEY